METDKDKLHIRFGKGLKYFVNHPQYDAYNEPLTIEYIAKIIKK